VQANATLSIRSDVPEGFLECPADRLVEILPGPTLFDLQGRDSRPLFVSVLCMGTKTAASEPPSKR
jgi:hypothetical protein